MATKPRYVRSLTTRLPPRRISEPPVNQIVKVTPQDILCFNGVCFRIIEVIPVAFACPPEMEVRARFEGVMQ